MPPLTFNFETIIVSTGKIMIEEIKLVNAGRPNGNTNDKTSDIIQVIKAKGFQFLNVTLLKSS